MFLVTSAETAGLNTNNGFNYLINPELAELNTKLIQHLAQLIQLFAHTYCLFTQRYNLKPDKHEQIDDTTQFKSNTIQQKAKLTKLKANTILLLFLAITHFYASFCQKSIKCRVERRFLELLLNKANAQSHPFMRGT